MSDTLLVSTAAIQTFLNAAGAKLRVDNILGKKTRTAIEKFLVSYDAASASDTIFPKDWESWSDDRMLVFIQQVMFKELHIETGKLDGLVGPATRGALEQWQNLSRNIPGPDVVVPAAPKQAWPRQAEAREFYGAPGTNQTKLKLPYKMRLAWDLGKSITSFSINKRCADSAERVLMAVSDHYTKKEISDLGLDIWSGCYNNRPMRGSHTVSMHAYACAIDFDDTHNQLRWGRDLARFARPEYDAWWGFWEDEGWVSLGRARNFDWMHVQAARL